MRKDSCSHWVYLKALFTALNHELFASTSGAILLNQWIGPQYIDVVTHGTEQQVIYDSALSAAIPWKVVDEHGRSSFISEHSESACKERTKSDSTYTEGSELSRKAQPDGNEWQTRGRKGFACPHCQRANAVGRVRCTGCFGRVLYKQWVRTQSSTTKSEDHPGAGEYGYGSMSIAVAADDEPYEAGGATLSTERGEKRSLPSHWNLATEFTRMMRQLRKVETHQRRWPQEHDYRVQCQAKGVTPMLPYPRIFECDWNPTGDAHANGDATRYKSDHLLINDLVEVVQRVRVPEHELELHVKEWLLKQWRSRTTPTPKECEDNTYSKTRRMLFDEAQRHGVVLRSNELRNQPRQVTGWRHQQEQQGHSTEWEPHGWRNAQWASSQEADQWGTARTWSAGGGGWDSVSWTTPQPPQQQRQPQQQQNCSEHRPGQGSNDTWHGAAWRQQG